jgi:hypothetical protein
MSTFYVLPTLTVSKDGTFVSPIALVVEAAIKDGLEKVAKNAKAAAEAMNSETARRTGAILIALSAAKSTLSLSPADDELKTIVSVLEQAKQANAAKYFDAAAVLFVVIAPVAVWWPELVLYPVGIAALAAVGLGSILLPFALRHPFFSYDMGRRALRGRARKVRANRG